MKLFITTQVRENYGAHDWDGKGECPSYWKNKGGNDYVVPNVDINRAGKIFEEVKEQCQEMNVFFEEYVIGWELVADDYLSEYEQDQLKYDGEIKYPARQLKVLEVA